jgi:hypothetical protein
MRYKALTGLNFSRDGKDFRVEPGTTVDNLIDTSIPWLLEQGLIEAVEDAPKKITSKKVKDAVVEEPTVEMPLVDADPFDLERE